MSFAIERVEIVIPVDSIHGISAATDFSFMGIGMFQSNVSGTHFLADFFGWVPAREGAFSAEIFLSVSKVSIPYGGICKSRVTVRTLSGSTSAFALD